MVDWNIDEAVIAALVKDPGVLDAAKDKADRAAQVARERVHVRSGRLRGSIKSERTADGAKVTYGGPEAPYAPEYEYGVRPHTIEAPEGHDLNWPGALHPVHEVHNPGSPAHHLLGNARDAAKG